MPLLKKGLRVKWCENVATYKHNKGHKLASVFRDGWYIQTWIGDKWHALTNLRFARERDAYRAAQSLTAAGLDSHGALAKADPMRVMQLACEFLQW